jgi:Fur family ferric uptake transcriptional regulator
VAWTERTEAILRDAGYRSGAARRIVVSVLGREGCCMTVPEIVDSARRQGEEVGVASVYRVLDLLTDKGLVQKIELGEGRARYERVEPEGERHHHHLVCNDCGRIEPFSDDALEAALRGVEQETGFAVASHDVLLRGSCGACRAA